MYLTRCNNCTSPLIPTQPILPIPLTPQATAVVYVTVEDQNDHTPMFVGAPYVSNISETTLIIATLQATDADAGMNAVIKFSIYVGNTTVFQIDENSVSAVCMCVCVHVCVCVCVHVYTT